MLKEILCESMESPDDRAVGFGAERIFRRPHSPRRGRPNASLGCQPGDRSPNTPLYLIRGLGPASEDVCPRPRIRWVADAQGAARTAHLGLEIDGLPSIQRAPTPPPCATVSPNRVFDEPASRFVNPTPPGPRPANACDLGLAAQRRPDVSPGCRQKPKPRVPSHHRTYGFPYPAVGPSGVSYTPQDRQAATTSTASRASCIAFCRDGRDTHPGSHRPRLATAPPLLPPPAPRFVPLGGEGLCGPGTPGNLLGVMSVAPLAWLRGPSALRSSGITRLPRYYGLC